MKHWLLVSAIVGAVSSPVLHARAAEADPQIIAHAGRLFDAAGEPLRGFNDVTFSLYTAKVGGARLWTEVSDVEFDEGYFDVWLGEATPLDPALLDGKTRWLGVAVGGAPESARRIAVASQTHPNLVRGAGEPRGAPPEQPQRHPPAPTVAPAPQTPQRPAGVVLSMGAVEARLAPLANERGPAFIGDTVGVSVGATQLVFVSASAALGSTAPGGAGDLQLSICHRRIGGEGLLDNRDTRLEDRSVAQHSRQTFALNTRFTGLAPGDYEVGLCGYVKRDAGRWNDNDRSRVTAMVTAG